MAKDMLYLPLRLIQSALGQKAEVKLLGRSQRERSQHRAVMGGDEVANLPGKVGSPVGWRPERASAAGAKFDQSALNATGRAAAHAVSGVLKSLVRHAITSCIQLVRFTDEVPRRPVLQGPVSLGYKFHTKGRGQASETGRVSPQPCLKGCQQRQSRGLRLGRFPGPSACSERQNLRVPRGPLRFMGPVSPAPAATAGRDRTSSGQRAGPLSNSPQQPKLGHPAVHPR